MYKEFKKLMGKTFEEVKEYCEEECYNYKVVEDEDFGLEDGGYEFYIVIDEDMALDFDKNGLLVMIE